MKTNIDNFLFEKWKKVQFCKLYSIFFFYYQNQEKSINPPIPTLKIITRIPSPRRFPLRVRTSAMLPNVCILDWTCNIKMWLHRTREIKLFPLHKNQPMEGFPQNFTSPLVLRIDYWMSILLEPFLLLQKPSGIIRGKVFKRTRLCEA